MPSKQGRYSLDGKTRYCDMDECMVLMPKGGLCAEHRLELAGYTDDIKPVSDPSRLDTNREVCYPDGKGQEDENLSNSDIEIILGELPIYKLIELARERRANA